jgi:Uncharacterized protein conserved in bacteria
MKNCVNRKYIVTADDYGMCSIVNQAIDQCISAGLVTSTNVILNMEEAEAAKTLRQRFPHISIGLHWNVTAGKPLLNKNRISTLINDDGYFYPVSTFLQLVRQKRINKQELILELTEQYLRFKDLCGQPAYWNTHQNSAFDFHTFNLFNELALQLGINKTRSFRRVYVKDKGLHHPKDWIMEMLKKCVTDLWFGYIIPRSGTKLPDGRMYYLIKNQNLDLLNITDNVFWRNKKLVEIVIHPSISQEYKYFGELSDIRVEEYKMFSSQQTRDALFSKSIELVNFDFVR